MPKSNLVPRNTRNKKDVNLLIAINEGLLMNCMKNKDLIKKSGIPQSTVYNDLRNPSSMTIERARIYLDVVEAPKESREGIL